MQITDELTTFLFVAYPIEQDSCIFIQKAWVYKLKKDASRHDEVAFKEKVGTTIAQTSKVTNPHRFT